MKKKIISFLILIPVISFSQRNDFALKIGIYTPYDLKTGVIYGIDYGSKINENLTFLFGADLYYKNITNDYRLGSEEKLGVKIGTGQRLNEWVGWHLPLTLKLRIEIPLERTPINPYIVGGVGYGITHISYEIYNNNSYESETSSLNYNGFVWQAGGGVLFRIGRRANLLFEIMHNSAFFEKEERYNMFTTLNSSGAIFRFGIDFIL
jgi:opacity protein-like surface antigen